MPEDGEGAAVVGRPVKQPHELRLGALCREAEVALFRERGIHRGERDLEQIERRIVLEAPRPEGPCDAGTKSDRIGKAERGVIAQSELGERCEVAVRIRAEEVVAVRRCGRERPRFGERRPEPRLTYVLLQARRRAQHAHAGPAPGSIDVVGQRHDEARPVVFDAKPAAEPLERRVERVEARPLGAKASVLVARTGSLLDARKVEERLCQLVLLGALAAFYLLPRLGEVRDVVAEPGVRGADRVEHPARAALDLRRNHRSALRTTRATWTTPGFRSPAA